MINNKRTIIAVTFLLVYVTTLFIYPGRLGVLSAEANKKSKTVLGYYTEDYPGDRLSYTSLAANSALIDSVAFFNYTIDDKGNLTTQPTSQGIKLAKDRGLKTLMLVNNMGKYNGREVAHKVLSVEKNRKNLVDNILKTIKRNGFNGVNIDLEMVALGDRENYNALLNDLKRSFSPYGYLLTVSVPAKTTDNLYSEWFGAYDYRVIGKTADLVAVMTYEEHWSGGSPGPIASLPWVQQVLDYSIKTMPRGKILMGIPAYGYDWSDTGGSTVRWNNVNALTARYPGVAWNNWYSSPYLIYYDENGKKHEAWFENKFSLRLKLDLVNCYNIAGIAVWRLGFEDADFWQVVKDKL